MSSVTMPSAGQSEPLYGGKKPGRVTVRDIAAAKTRGEKWPMLTTYDALTAGIFDEAGIPVLLVGDSAGNVVFGYDTTIPVTVDDLIPLTAAVVRGTKRAMVVADLPFGSYQASPTEALHAAVRFMKEAGAHAVKLEGGMRVAHQVEELTVAGIPVMGHLGLTPQSVHAFGGFRVQGRGEEGQRLLHDAKALEAAGAFAIVLEGIPPRSPRRSPRRCASRPSASAPARTATRRCSSGRTWPACRPARPSSPSATPTWPGCCAPPRPSSPRRWPAGPSRRRSTPTSSVRPGRGKRSRPGKAMQPERAQVSRDR